MADDKPEEAHNAAIRKSRLKGRLNWALRLGYEIPLGDVSISSSSQTATGYTTQDFVLKADSRFALHVALASRVLPELALGGYAKTTMYSGPEVDVGASVGACVHYYPKPIANSVFWLGLGGGYQWVGFTEGAFHGIEIAPQAGIDFSVGQSTLLGPFAELAAANYTTSLCSGCSGWGTWGSVGVRLSGR